MSDEASWRSWARRALGLGLSSGSREGSDLPPADAADPPPTVDVSGSRVRAAGPEAPFGEIGGFRILGKLGEGGMGIVYEAEQRSPHRRVALKIVRGGLHVDELQLRLSRRESETLARLAHPNIAAIYEASRTEDGRPFFTMELIKGRTLSEFVAERLGGSQPTPTQLRERLRLFAVICRAVNYAHQRGVIHRDLKPSNLVVNEAGEVKILDFGLARVTDVEVGGVTATSEVGTIRGTIPYMSPEQTRGDNRDVDLRSDVYALGVILQEMLSGRLPYELSDKSVLQAIRTICEEPPRPLRATASGAALDPDLGTIAAKALAKEPDGRYQSAGALADDVERYLANRPILAHPPSAMYQIRKLVARNRGRVTALGVIALLLVALGITSLVQARRVRQQRDRAQAEAAKSEAINRFLLDALGAADPWQRGSRSVTLLDALHQARTKAHAAFQGQPLVEASVLQILGMTFAGLAEFDEAEAALRDALALREASVGRRSVEGVESLDGITSLYIYSQRYPEAASVAREAIEISNQVYGPGSLHSAAAMNNLSTALAQGTEVEQARTLAKQVLEIIRSRRAHPDEAEGPGIDPGQMENYARANLATIALRAGDTKTMLEIDLERLQAARAQSPGPSAELSNVLNDLGTAQMMSGDLESAEKTYLEAIETIRIALGEEHPMLATTTENLGNVYFRQNKLDKTTSCLEQVLALRRKTLGDDSEPVARTFSNMASLYRKQGKHELAERTYHEAIERMTRKLGPKHPDLATTIAGLGDELRRQGRFAEAQAPLDRGLAILVEVLGESNPQTQRVIQWQVDLYTDWKKPDQAALYARKLTPKS